MKQTWIVVADGAAARILAYQGPRNPLKPVEEFTHINEPSRELVTNKRGRVFQSADNTRFNMTDTARSAMENPTDPHEHEKQVFAREIAEFLEENRKAFDRLILAAAPKVLGDLRTLLTEEIRAGISAELDKDLTKIADEDLPEHLQEVLNITPHPRTLPEHLPYAKP